MLKHCSGELNEYSVHESLPKGQQALHEPNVTTSTGRHEDEIGIASGTFFRDSCTTRSMHECTVVDQVIH